MSSPLSNKSSNPQSKQLDSNESQSVPISGKWYKNYMVVIFVIGLPLLVVVACIWFVVYSIQIGDTVVRDDWYMDGKALYQDVSRDKLMYDLELLGEITVTQSGEIEFMLNYPTESLMSQTFKDGSPLTYPKDLYLSISHATDIQKDREGTLVHSTNNGADKNRYTATVDIDPLPSKYYIEVSNEGKHNWRMRAVAQSPFTQVMFEPLPSMFEK